MKKENTQTHKTLCTSRISLECRTWHELVAGFLAAIHIYIYIVPWCHSSNSLIHLLEGFGRWGESEQITETGSVRTQDRLRMQHDCLLFHNAAPSSTLNVFKSSFWQLITMKKSRHPPEPNYSPHNNKRVLSMRISHTEKEKKEKEWRFNPGLFSC